MANSQSPSQATLSHEAARDGSTLKFISFRDAHCLAAMGGRNSHECRCEGQPATGAVGSEPAPNGKERAVRRITQTMCYHTTGLCSLVLHIHAILGVTTKLLPGIEATTLTVILLETDKLHSRGGSMKSFRPLLNDLH